MILLEGKMIAEKILAEIKKEITESGSRPGLGVVLVGTDEASKIYVNLKKKAAEEIGINFEKIEMPESSTEEEIIREIERLNIDDKINGIIVQLPLPGNLNKEKIISAIDSAKDADGFHPENMKKFMQSEAGISPVFPEAIWELINSAPILQELSSWRKALIICNSEEFGKVMQKRLEMENISSEFIFCEDVQNSLEKIKQAEILITACGKPNFIKSEFLKDGMIVIDGGITKLDGRVVGDVDAESVGDKNFFLSPVPGGVGPVTIACLLQNVWKASKKF